jgi:hypothetical protein
MTKTPQVIKLFRGLPSNLKTEEALAWVAEDKGWRIRVSADELAQTSYGLPFDQLARHESEATETLEHALVSGALKAGLSVAIDDHNLRIKTVREWQSKAEKLKIDFEIEDVEVEVTDETRDLYQRFFVKGKFPEIPAFAVEEEERGAWTTYVPDESLPEAILFDIDGTLMKMKGRSPFDWHRVKEDEPIVNVMKVARILQKELPIISLSGRDEVCHDDSMNSLIEHGVYPTALHMRPANSYIPDDIVKHELFYKYVAPFYNVVGVFDDRLKVCRMWEEIGLTLFRVGPIDSDF